MQTGSEDHIHRLHGKNVPQMWRAFHSPAQQQVAIQYCVNCKQHVLRGDSRQTYRPQFSRISHSVQPDQTCLEGAGKGEGNHSRSRQAWKTGMDSERSATWSPGHLGTQTSKGALRLHAFSSFNINIYFLIKIIKCWLSSHEWSTRSTMQQRWRP